MMLLVDLLFAWGIVGSSLSGLLALGWLRSSRVCLEVRRMMGELVVANERLRRRVADAEARARGVGGGNGAQPSIRRIDGADAIRARPRP